MKKSWQRLGSAFLAFLMVFTMLPASVLADSGTAAGDSLNVSGTPAVRSVINPGTDSSSYQTYRFYVEGTLVDTQVVKTGDTLYAPATPAKEGHKFLGWSQSQSGGSYFTAFGAQTVTADGEVNLYADFAKVYYVFFMDTRGRVYATKEGTTGDSIAADVTFPVNADQAITGWYTEAGLTNRVESVTLGEANITLYPKVENGHWITYDSKGGSYVEPAFVAPSGVTVAPAAPSRPGYTFGGWTRNGSAFTFGGALSENIQLEASWTANDTTYTVVYWIENADDDGYSYESSRTNTGVTGSTITLSNSQNGYSTSNIDSSYRNYFTYDRYDTGKTISGDGSTIVNVYYSRNTYTLTFRVRSGNWNPSYQTVATITAKYNSYIADEFGKAPFSTTYSGRAWEATSYYDYALQTLDRMPGQNVIFNLYEKSSDTLKTIYYYVQKVDSTANPPSWGQGGQYDQLKTVQTYFNYATYDEEYHEIEGFTRFSQSAAGFRNNRKDFSNRSLKLYYIRNFYNLQFYNVNGIVNTASVKYQAPLAGRLNYVPSRPANIPASYEFVGWYTSPACEDGTEAADNLTTMPAGDVVVYAKWAAPTFTGTIHVTMAGSGATNIIEIPYGSTIDESTLEHEEVPAGSEWVGWALRTGSEGHYTYTPFNFDTRIYGDITLYPYYISTTAFTVSYDANSGSGAPADSKRYAQDSYAEIMASSGMTAPANKIFLSWNTESDGSGDTYYPKDKLHIGTENITLYAQWGDAPVPVSVSYHANYPDSTTADPYVVSGLRNNDQHTVLSLEGCGFAKAQADYEFLGWSTSESDTEAEYAVGAQIRLDNKGENHLYAIWKAKPVLVITANSGSRPYDGTALTADGYKLTVNGGAAIEVGADGVHTFENGDVLSVVITGSQTDAGESANAVTSYTIQRGAAAVTGKYKVTAVNGKLEVTPKAVTIKAADDDFTYDGSAHSNANYTVTGLVGSDAVTATVAGSITYPSQSPVKNEVTGHTFTAGRADNYTVSYADGQLTMTYGAAQAITVTADSKSWTYDGNAHAQDSYTVKIGDGKPQPVGAAGVYTFANGDVLTVVVEGSVTNVAEGEVTNAITSLTITNQGEDVSGAYSITRNNGTLKINPKAVKVIAASEAFKYDGKAHSNAGYTAEGLVGSDAISAVVEGSITYPSQSPVDNVLKSYEFTAGTAGNYSVTTENGTLTMSYADAVEITVTAGSKSWTYDGNAHNQDSYTLKIGNGAPIPVGADGIYTFENGDVLTVEITGSVTNVAEGTVANAISSLTITNGTVDVSGAYAVTRSNGTLKINPKTVTIKAADDDFTYDGSAHSNANYTVTGLVGSDKVTATVAGSIAYPSQSPVKNEVTGHAFTAGSADNYTVSYADGQLTMTYGAAQAITVTADSNSWPYDGNAHSQDSYTLQIGNDAPISVGADGVYTFANGDVLTVEITGSVTNVAEGTVANTVASLTITNGAEDVSAAYAVTRNNGTLKIDPKAVTITAKSKEFEYDGQPHSYSSYSVNGLVDDDEISATVTGSITYPSESPVANQVTAHTFVKGAASNYAVEYVDGTLTMVPSTTEVTVTITGNHDSRVYNASEQSVTGFTTDVGTKTISVVLADGSEAVAKGTGVGHYEMGLTKDDFVVTSDNYSNIKVVVVDGYLDITPTSDEVTVTITGNHDSRVYNTSEQSVTGFTTDVGEKTISVVLADGSEAVAKGTDVGNYKMGLTEDDFVVTSDNYSNIKVVVVDGYLDITPTSDEVTVTITGNHDSRVYNTSEQSVTGFTTDVGEKTISVVLADGSEAVAKGTDVGNYKMGLTEDDFVVTSDNYSNIKVVVVDGYLDITPTSDEVTVTITGNHDSRVYNTSEQSVTGFTTDVGEKTISVVLADGSEAVAKGTDVGNYKMGLTEDDFVVTSDNYSNIKVVVVDGYLDITPTSDEVTVTITGNHDSRVYNTSEQSVTGFTTDVGEKTISVVLADGSEAVAKGTNVGSYKMGLTEDDFVVTSDNYSNIKVVVVDGYLDITPTSDEVTVTITGNHDSRVYNTSEQSVTGFTTDVGEKTISVVLADGSEAVAKGTNVGSYKMGLTEDDFVVTSDNYSNIKVVVVDGYLDITPTSDEVTVTITGNHDSRVYNTSEQSVTGFTTDVGEKTISVVLADGSEAVAKGTNVGSYKMGLTEDDFVVTSDNYSNIKVVVVDGYLDITPTSDEVTVTITGHTDTRTYNGREYTVTGYDVSSSNPFYTEADFRFNGTASVSGTDADSYPMGLTEDDFSNTNRNFSNVVFDVTDGGLTIDPKAVTITAASEEFEYNGQPRSNAGYTVEGLVGSDAISAVVEGSITYPSQSPVKNTVVSHEFTTGNPNNYEVSYAVGELTMTAASGEIVVTITGKNDTAKYDGEEHTVTGYDVTISSVLYTENDFTFNGTASASRIDAGTTDMGLTAEDFVNHNDSFSNVVFVVEDGFVTVEKRVLTLTSASDEKLYDSYPLRNDKVTVSGDGFAEGEGAVYDVTGVQRDPGDSKNTFDYLLNDGTKAENYEITKVEGTLKITAPDSLYYSIEYYYNGIINPSMTRTVSGVKLGDVIENVDAASITEGELSGSYKFIEAVGLPLTIGVETSENVLRLYYESGEIAHDPDAAIQIIHQYYTDGRFSGEQKRSLDSAEAGQQIYIDNRNMPANQVIRSAPIYGRRGYDFDGSRIRVERTPFSYEVIFHGNGFVADPASISVNYKSNFTIPADGTANLIWMTEEGKKLVAEVIEAIETTGIDSGSDSADFLAYLMAQRYPNEHGKEYFFPGQEYPLATAANLDLYAYVLKRTTLTNADISEAFAQAESDLIALKRAVARGVDPEDTGFVGALRSLFGMKKVDPDLKARYQACYEALSDEIYELGDLLDRFEEENDKKLSEKTWERYGNLLAGLTELEEMIENLDVIIDSGYQDSGYQDSGYLDSGFTVTRTSSGSGVSVQKKSVSFLEGLFGGMQVAQVVDYGTSATYPMTITKLDSFLYEEGYTYTVTLTYNRTTGGGGGGDNDDPTPIPDNPVPLGPSPDLVTILDEEVPLGKLPTSGSNRNAHRAGGAALMAVILGLLAKGRRRDGEGGSGEGTDSSGE